MKITFTSISTSTLRNSYQKALEDLGCSTVLANVTPDKPYTWMLAHEILNQASLHFVGVAESLLPLVSELLANDLVRSELLATLFRNGAPSFDVVSDTIHRLLKAAHALLRMRAKKVAA